MIAVVEANWVLGSAYRYDPDAIRDALRELLGLNNLAVEDRPVVSRALALAAHGIDFADATEVFGDPKQYTYRSAVRSSETRYVSVGTASGSLIAVVFTWRGKTVRIISARAARRSERDKYG